MLLRRGDVGTKVSSLQKLLTTKGFEAKPDARFGLHTEAAVRCFQAEHKLTNDGLVGNRTEAAMRAAPDKDAVNPVSIMHKTFWRSQNDNEYVPNGTCNVTSLAVVLSYLGEAPRREDTQLEDELFEQLQRKDARVYFEKVYPWAKNQGYHPRNVHGMLQWLAKSRGYEAKLLLNEPIIDISTHLKHTPLITTGAFTGSGHIVCITGITACGDYIVQDPYGDWIKGYRSNPNGAMLIYPHHLMNKVIGHRKAGHCLLHKITKE